MEIWPAIDIRGGKCVRLRQGDYGRETVFGDHPAEMAAHWVQRGAARLHLVDLDGAREGQPENLEAVADILRNVGVPCQMGGGIREESTIGQLLDSGLERLVVGTRAHRDPEWFRAMCQQFPHKLALGIDARDGRVATDGWLKTSDMAAVQLAEHFADDPVGAVIYTDIARDGMMAGPNLVAMRGMVRATKLPVIASGGVTSVQDVRQLAGNGLAGCIIGRALYEEKLTLEEAMDAAK